VDSSDDEEAEVEDVMDLGVAGTTTDSGEDAEDLFFLDFLVGFDSSPFTTEDKVKDETEEDEGTDEDADEDARAAISEDERFLLSFELFEEEASFTFPWI
jgi:hypothetical protein